MNEKVSVIIPAYNAEATIDRCLKSLLNQNTQDKYRIIVLNDGSTDSTLSRLAKYADNNKIDVINKKNTGASDTRNQGLNLVKSKYVTFVDADDYVEPDYLESLLRQYSNRKCDLSIIGYCKEDMDKTVRFKGLGNKKILNRERALHDILISTGYEGYLWNKLFKMSIIRKNDIKFDSAIKIAEDLLFCCKYISYCNYVSLDPEVKYHYVVNDNSQINSKKYGSEFTESSMDILKVYEQIKLMVVTMNYPKVISAINASIVWSSTSILRMIYLAPNKSSVSSEVMSKLKENQRIYRHDFLKNDILPKRDKLIYWFNYYFPSLFAILWRKMQLRGNGF